MTNKRKEPRWDEAEQKFILLLAGVIIGVAIIVVASRIELVAWVLAALIGIIVVGIIGYILWAATNILWLMYKSTTQDDNLVEKPQNSNVPERTQPRPPGRLKPTGSGLPPDRTIPPPPTVDDDPGWTTSDKEYKRTQ